MHQDQEIKLITFGGKFYLEGLTFANNHIAQRAGFHFDRGRSCWVSPDWRDADRVIQYADEKAWAMVEDGMRRSHAARLRSTAHDALIDVPCPDGLAVRNFQKASVAFFEEVTGAGGDGILIGDEMGTGKSIQAMSIVNYDQAINRVLIICPATLKLNWRNEARKWLAKPLTISVINAKDKTKDFDADIVIINYDIVVKYKAVLQDIKWDLVVCDESHMLKNAKAQRTVAILGGMRPATKEEAEKEGVAKKRVPKLNTRSWVLMTGTPILNRPCELWTTLSLLDKRGLGSDFFGFHQRYCNGKKTYGGHWDFSGASHLDELQEKLRSSIMIRRLKADVLSELPAKVRTIIPIEAAGKSKKAVLTEKDLDDKKRKIESRLEIKRAQGSFAEGDAALVAELTAKLGETIDEMTTLRKELAVLKANECKDLLTLAAESHPVIIFTHHHEATDTVVANLKADKMRVCKIDGRDSQEDRQERVEKFQAGEYDAIVLGIRAASVGLTLTHSSHVIFLELDWTPGIMAQAEDRAHRIGQRDSVQVDYLVYDESMDAYLAQTLIEKEGVITQAMDDNTTPEETVEEAVAAWKADAEQRVADHVRKEVARIKGERARADKLRKEQAAQLWVEVQHLQPVEDPGKFVAGMFGDGFFYVEAVGRIGDQLHLISRKGNRVYLDGVPTEPITFDAVWHRGACSCCGRPLSDPESIRLGIGPTCRKK